MDDGEVVDAFVQYLSNNGHGGLKVDRHPDKENRGSSDIDAIAGNFAIEHTSLDTLPNQRRDSDWFMQVIGTLEQEISRPCFRLNVTIPYSAVNRGQDWTAIKEAVRRWIVTEVPPLADGIHKIDDVAGIPFQIHALKSSDRPPGIFFGRWEPDDNTLPARIKQQFDRKAKKLKRYSDAGRTTVLLVESSDIALMNGAKMLDAIHQAYPSGLPVAVKQVWFADASIPETLEFTDISGLL